MDDLGSMVLLRMQKENGLVEYEHMPAAFIALLLLDPPEDCISAKIEMIEEGSMTEWIRSI